MDKAIAGWHQIYSRLEAGEDYDSLVYALNSYGSFIWELQKPLVLATVSSLAARRKGLKYLDFACGTARVLAAIQPLVATAVGVDVSGPMLARAAEKAPGAILKQGDLLQNPTLVDHDYDVITAFRFFLNADTARRLPTLRCLAQRLKDDGSLLIFNVHGNSHGLDGLVSLRDRRFVTMSPRQIRNLIAQAGLLVEAWFGFGLTPACGGAPHLRRIARAADVWAAQHQALRPISRDLLFVCRRRS